MQKNLMRELSPEKKTFEFKLGRFALNFGSKTHVMGILNRTPDSFYDGGRFFDLEKAVSHVHEMADSGADLIDIGGQSTRPGSEPISLEEEMERVIPVVESVAHNINVPISVDTCSHFVAEESLRRGASIVNDITGLKGDPKMADVVAKYDAGVILMHIKGTPKNMQDHPCYDDVIGEITDYLRDSIRIAIEAGISSNKIIVDPGIGFGKTAEHNMTIINRLSELKTLQRPILIGVSRKSFIRKVLNLDTEELLIGTAAACAVSIANGADIIRVHDVKEMGEVARVADAILRERISW